MTTDPMFVSDKHRQRQRDHRFPYCDTCGEPAVFKEGRGVLHSTDAFPFGVPEHLDTSGHSASFRTWMQEDA